ncbi:hypothetical protein VTK73DRAFT_7998 [Phialemonium thermophilum]|uniref:protein-ribulosamine 3-kinase n=1 Tax=Phialemonium thermophilum TaxID=223376 RepID=A0ABR3XQB6_9PEZI
MAVQLQNQLKNQLALLSNSRGGSLPLDDAVQAALPAGTAVRSVSPYGESAWSFTAKIDAVDKDGQPFPVFLKYVAGELGHRQLDGEFAGMSELHKLAPDLVPRPIAWGKVESLALETYFLLIEFKNFASGLPDPVRLGARLAEMHKKSESPTRMFGFHVQTFDGARLQSVAWDPSWTSFFSKLLAEAYRQDAESNGVWPELEIVYNRVQTHLIPRLIGALEADGRSVKPCLIHGDLWEGNIGTDGETGDPWIFDCAAYYAHNEMELGIWRADRHQLKAPTYRAEYLKNFEASEPEEEWDDRNRLYSAKTNFMHSACYAKSPARQLAFEDMLFLVQKYVPWDEGSTEWQLLSQEAVTTVADAGLLAQPTSVE